VGVEVKIEKPAEFYEEVKQLIHEHYRIVHPPGSFGSKYPVVYHLYLQIAALGLRRNEDQGYPSGLGHKS